MWVIDISIKKKTSVHKNIQKSSVNKKVVYSAASSAVSSVFSPQAVMEVKEVATMRAKINLNAFMTASP